MEPREPDSMTDSGRESLPTSDAHASDDITREIEPTVRLRTSFEAPLTPEFLLAAAEPAVAAARSAAKSADTLDRIASAVTSAATSAADASISSAADGTNPYIEMPVERPSRSLSPSPPQPPPAPSGPPSLLQSNLHGVTRSLRAAFFGFDDGNPDASSVGETTKTNLFSTWGEESAPGEGLILPAAPFARVSAKFVDLFLVIVVSVLIADKVSDKIGPLVGIMYSLCADRIWPGQSLGKKLFHLKVQGLLKPRTFRLQDSVVRNAPVGVLTAFAMVNFTGWILLVLIGFPFLLIEIYLILKAPNAQRLGDVMADTVVVHK